MAIRTRLGQAEDLLAELANGRLDLVISTVRPRRRTLQVAPLCDEEFVLVAAPALLATFDQASGAEHPGIALQAMPLLAYAEDLPVVRRWWRHVLGVAPPGRAVLVVPDLRALRAAAVAGVGATVLPRHLCTDDLATDRLALVLQVDDPPINTLYLATRTTTRNEPHIAHAWAAVMGAARNW